MALSHELPIYKDTYKLILLIFEYTKEFAREYKYTLGQDMKRDSIKLIFKPSDGLKPSEGELL